MVHASQRGWRPGLARTLFVGGLCLIGLFGLSSVTGQTKKASKATATPTTPKTGTKGRQTLKLTIASKDSEIANVSEMSKVINTKLEESWKANKITPSAYTDDYEFIRRASLDIIGRSATVPEIQVYLKDAPDKRRSKLIERLLASDDYPRHWANMWANWLLTRSGDFGRGKYHDQTSVWLEDQFAQNKPFNEITTKLLTASGKNTENGAVNFLLGHLGEPIPAAKQKEEGQYEMVPLTSRITRVFLGTQVQCAQCHAHPFFAALKQESFWGINAFLRQIRRDGPRMMAQNNRMGPLPDLTLRDDESANPDANVFFEMRNGKVRMLSAEFLAPPGKERGPRLDPSKKGVARREELAKHVTEHEMFAKAFVNRMWGLFFGRGFVNPIDDFNDNNAPSNPELLNELAARFKHYNYDVKKLIRWMTHSNAYHLSYVANKTNDKPELESQFSRMIMKSFTPEQLFESLTASTSSKKMTAAAKKKLRDEWLSRLITNFGDDEGNEVNFNGTIVQALLMMNGKNINDAISSADGTVAAAMARNKTSSAVINELYLAALNRPPRPAEAKRINTMASLRGVKDSPKAMYEDLIWALLNSNEFLLNH